jgi:hypothetical protein
LSGRCWAGREIISGEIAGNTTNLTWLVGDHLGSGTASLDAACGTKTFQRYTPWGSPRGTPTLLTTSQFTGQRMESSMDLMCHGSRWYD